MRISNNEFVENALVAVEEFTGAVFMNSESFMKLKRHDVINLVPDEGGARPVFAGRRVFVDDSLENGMHGDWSDRTKAIHRRFGSVGRIVSASRFGIETEQEIEPVRPIRHITVESVTNTDALKAALGELAGNLMEGSAA